MSRESIRFHRPSAQPSGFFSFIENTYETTLMPHDPAHVVWLQVLDRFHQCSAALEVDRLPTGLAGGSGWGMQEFSISVFIRHGTFVGCGSSLFMHRR
jgi:hypothetical protein